MTNPARLRDFVRAFTSLADTAAQDEVLMLEQGRALLADLVTVDDWLPAAFAQPHPDRYQQYLLHCDPRERFSVVSFVWGPGQATPVHDHTVWGMVGVLRGAEQCEEFAPPAGSGPLQALGAHHLPAGAIDIVSPRVGDIHRVSNACPGAVSVSIHVYGADIGRVERHVYEPATGAATRFVSGYSARATPENWQ
ncbi:cysteine dioxygenase [Massilia violaceinigra]|uniref:Cysteine dioxygenase n=1 Tax=Massilia violaceinigra TaxID=2045208 RepID=A0A2D2DMJ2_9BURK|nr:cysteine dioxygenase [Massilia violaceinigra]ATQ76206.1 cysteine dioxygenase [Massilia violaceinigra]